METSNPSTEPPIVRFGTFEVNVRTGELRKRGVRLALQEQPLRILAALLERPGVVVGREDLCRRLWPHGTFVDFEHSLNAAVRRLRLVLGEDADVPRFVETVHKRGYRFLAQSELTPSPMVPRRPSGRARLAVLPFGPGDGFTEGLTEEALTQLAQSSPRTIAVIAQTSVQRAHRDGVGAAEMGRALEADYLLDGRVRREGDRVRITAHLIASQEETHVWADTFDRVMTDALSVQTEVAEAITKAVLGSIAPASEVP